MAKLFSGHVVAGDTLVLLIVADFMDISELFLLYAQHFVFSLSHNFLLVILGSEPTMICGNPLLCSIHNPQFSPILPILTHWSHELPTLPI